VRAKKTPLYKLTHTLVIVRQAWTNGVNYNFFGGIAKTFMREKNWSWRSFLTFVSFGQAKENKKIIPIAIGTIVFL
jgi:hypothetical protein